MDHVNSNSNNNNSNSTFYQNIAVRYAKKSFTSVAVNCLGSLCILGAKKTLYIIDLEKPLEPKKKLQQQGNSEVVVEWNPHSSHSNIFASTEYTDTVLWSIEEDRLATIQTHTRAVSHISWSLFDPNILATCSNDTNINLWDVRNPKRSFKESSFCAYTAGATQVKWNRLNPFLLASAHYSDVLIWDTRKQAQPITQITVGNAGNTCSIDWSYLIENELITCSHDTSIKVWNYNNPRDYKGILPTGIPLQRVKYTPNGNSIVTVAKRGQPSLHMWSLKDVRSMDSSNLVSCTPIHIFTGYNDVISSIDWRVKRSDIKPYEVQLISWGKDECLRMWKIDSQEAFLGNPSPNHKTTTLSGTPSSREDILGTSIGELLDHLPEQEDFLLREVLNLPQQPTFIPPTLEQEFAEVQKKLGEFVKIDNMNSTKTKRDCVFTCVIAENEKNHESLGEKKEVICFSGKVVFPSLYPNNAAPSFEFFNDAPVFDFNVRKISDQQTIFRSMLEALNEIAKNQVQENKPCLEKCLRKLLQLVLVHAKGLGFNEPVPVNLNHKKPEVNFEIDSGNNVNRKAETDSPQWKSHIVGDLRSSGDSLPSPRTSGVYISPTGMLVCFKSLSMKLLGNPRTYSDLQTQMKLLTSSMVSPPQTPHTLPTTLTFSKSPANHQIVPLQSSLNLASASGKNDQNAQKMLLSLSQGGYSPSSSGERLINTQLLIVTKSTTPFSLSMDLAKDYTLTANAKKVVREENESNENDTRMESICKTNEEAAFKSGRPDLARTWAIMGVLTEPSIFKKRLPCVNENGEYFPEEMEYMTNDHSNLDSFDERDTLDTHSTRFNHHNNNNNNNNYNNNNNNTPSKYPHPWVIHPFGRGLVKDIYSHYKKQGDLQTLAMMSCTLSVSQRITLEGKANDQRKERLQRVSSLDSVNSSMSIDTDTNTSTTTFSELSNRNDKGKFIPDPPPLPTSSKMKKENSNQSIFNLRRASHYDFPIQSNQLSPPPSISTSPNTPSQHLNGNITSSSSSNVHTDPLTTDNSKYDHIINPITKLDSLSNIQGLEYSLLPPHLIPESVQYINNYSELLFRWEMLEKRADLLKSSNLYLPNLSSDKIALDIVCNRCHKIMNANRVCLDCKGCQYSSHIKCTICHIAVKGLSNFCLVCGHGGHSKHIKDWFQKVPFCPTAGCGCRCLFNNISTETKPFFDQKIATSIQQSSPFTLQTQQTPTPTPPQTQTQTQTHNSITLPQISLTPSKSNENVWQLATTPSSGMMSASPALSIPSRSPPSKNAQLTKQNFSGSYGHTNQKEHQAKWDILW